MERATFDDKVVLGAILILALVLRVWGLNQPLWYDELLTLFTHIRLPWGEMMAGYEMNHHYLYSFQSKLVTSLLGESPWALRLTAVLFGVASIAATWVLVRDVSSARYAHITAGLLAMSYHHIWFSQNARGYTELMFWCTIGLIAFLRGLGSDRLGPWMWFAAALAFAVFTHLTGFFFFFAIGVVWLFWCIGQIITRRAKLAHIYRPGLAFAAGGLVCLALYAPVLSSVVETASSVGGTSKVDVMQEFQNPIWTVLEAIRTVATGLGPIIGLIALAVLALAALGAAKIWNNVPLFPIIVAAHIGLTMALLFALGMRIWPRFFFVDIGFLMALIVLGVAYTCDIVERLLPGLNRRVTFALGVLGMFAISALLASQNYRAPKQNIPGPVALIAQEAAATDKIFAVGFVGDVYVDHMQTGWGRIMDGTELHSALSQSEAVWLVVGFPTRTFRAVEGLEEAVERFELVKRFPGTLGDGAMLVYRRKGL